jgi:hypothetical protein
MRLERGFHRKREVREGQREVGGREKPKFFL